jgi:hypothetical protein
MGVPQRLHAEMAVMIEAVEAPSIYKPWLKWRGRRHARAAWGGHDPASCVAPLSPGDHTIENRGFAWSRANRAGLL